MLSLALYRLAHISANQSGPSCCRHDNSLKSWGVWEIKGAACSVLDFGLNQAAFIFSSSYSVLSLWPPPRHLLTILPLSPLSPPCHLSIPPYQTSILFVSLTILMFLCVAMRIEEMSNARQISVKTDVTVYLI